MAQSRIHIKRLIAESSLEEAADLLSQAWQGKDASFYNLTIQLKERFSALKKETALGVISRADAELERAKITDALLFLCDKLDHPSIKTPRHLQHYFPTEEKSFKKTWVFVAAAALLLVAITYFLVQSFSKPTDFNLKVFIDSPTALSNAHVKLALGDYQLPPREVDAQGRVDFTDIPIKYKNDSLHLILMDLPYEVANQSAATAAQSANGSVTFELKPIIQWTSWRGTLKDAAGKPIANAKLDIESGLASVITNEDGNFSVKIPRAAGERVQVTGYLNGEQVLNSSFILTEQIPTQIQLNR